MGPRLLERALGELPGVLSIGETVHLWDRGLRDNELCGCGQPFSSCPFWRSVGDVAFGGWDTWTPTTPWRFGSPSTATGTCPC